MADWIDAASYQRLYRPVDERARVSIEALIYYRRFSTIMCWGGTVPYLVYVDGMLHSEHPTLVDADKALQAALKEQPNAPL